MSALVTYRRRRAQSAAQKGWEAALEHCARFLQHGAVAAVHLPGCGKNYDDECNCPPGAIQLIGPAERDVWN